jgi:RNA polymerase sigma-70 factor (ECF subfamily)
VKGVDGVIDLEDNLIKKAQKGNVDAFEKLVYKYEKLVFNLAFSMLRNEQDAYDIAQEVFIKVYQSISTFNFTAKFSTWIHRITVNTTIDEIRKRKNKETEYIDQMVSVGDGEVQKQFEDTSPTPEDQVLIKERNQDLIDSIKKLKEEHRIVLTLRDIKGYSYDEIADILDCSLGTVKSRISRARSNLKEIYLEKVEQNKT